MDDISVFILRHIDKHESDIVALTSAEFGLSRVAIWRRVSKLAQDGMLISAGNTKAKKYHPRIFSNTQTEFKIGEISEDKAWSSFVRAQLPAIERNVYDICQYGFTEMFNNAIDHSQGTTVSAHVVVTSSSIEFSVIDNGIGIFNKIQAELSLDDPGQSLLELAKGKFTTDPQHHSGEGVFFSSRMFDEFRIYSDSLTFVSVQGEDWLLEHQESCFQGTGFVMTINRYSERTLQGVFDKYATSDDYGFNRTVVPVSLAQIGDDNLVSRSQAKRLLSRFERFEEVVLDFKGVAAIGQAFADEIFRVFVNEHPQVLINPVKMNKSVEQMVTRAFALKDSQGS